MTLDQISEEWRKDAGIDSTELGAESLKIPQLHSKFMKIYFDERQRLRAYEFKSKATFLMKNEVDMYVDSDADIVDVNMRIVAQKEKIDFLEEVLKNLNQRNYQIKNAIDWQRFTNGVN
jgi:hypothetical protein